jgi:hypothetical protein
MLSAANYTFRGVSIPARMAPDLQRWIERGELPGDFLQAVLRNDLREAVGRADAENLIALPAYIGYLYNEADPRCYGSPEKVKAWARIAVARGASEVQTANCGYCGRDMAPGNECLTSASADACDKYQRFAATVQIDADLPVQPLEPSEEVVYD